MGKPIHEPYAPEVRARAVELVRSGGLSRAQVARDLGVNPGPSGCGSSRPRSTPAGAMG